MSPRPAVQDDRNLARERVRERIVESFAQRAAVEGPRGVVMAELARDLGISTRTLYQHFKSKAELVSEIMQNWVLQLGRDQAERMAREDLSPTGKIQDAAAQWVEAQSAFSSAFWSQVQADYPEAAEILKRHIAQGAGAAREQFSPFIRSDLDHEFAFTLLRSAMRTAADPQFCNRLGISRQASVRQAIELWSKGALGDPPR